MQKWLRQVVGLCQPNPANISAAKVENSVGFPPSALMGPVPVAR